MPYFIAKSRATCKDGWAVIDQAGAIFGCHAGKQDAIDQAIAISLADKQPFMGERAAEGELQVGDYVQWIADTDAMFGEILSIDTTEATVKIYEEQDGVWIESVFTEVVPVADLTKIADLPVVEPMTEDASRNASGDPIILSDIDGTLLNGGSRNNNVWDYIQSLEGALFILTGRPESERTVTEQDLASADITYSRLIMNDGSTANSPEFKKVKAEELLKTYNIVAAIENNADTVRKFKELGIDAVTPASLRWSKSAETIISRLEPQTESEVMTTDVRAKWVNVAYAIKGKLEGVDPEKREKAQPEQRMNVANFEVRETADGMTFTGYAAVFNSDSQPLPFTERIAPGAFKRSLQNRSNVKLLWNHDSGEPLASTRGGSLHLTEDNYGLKVEARLANTTRGRDVAELIRSNVIDSMSFGFSVIKDSWVGDVRTLEAVRLFEVSIVSSPAYEATAGTVAVRSVDTGIDADQLADALFKLESGEELEAAQASLITDVVSKLTKTEEVQAVDGDILALKKKKLELLMKEINA
jgi:HK97 family phage prohead protease